MHLHASLQDITLYSLTKNQEVGCVCERERQRGRERQKRGERERQWISNLKNHVEMLVPNKGPRMFSSASNWGGEPYANKGSFADEIRFKWWLGLND